jgi:hypothetical protein
LIKYDKEDREKIFSLMKKLGSSHSVLVRDIYHKILGVDKRFSEVEPNWTDIVYVSKMILIYSAAET